MLLAQQQEEEIEIDAEHQDLLADRLEGFESDCEELQLNATSIQMTKKVDAYNSEVDDAPTISAIFMVKLSPASSINGDEVGLSYDSYILSEVLIDKLKAETISLFVVKDKCTKAYIFFLSEERVAI
ncbi:hypothetical protein Tco_1026473 [Tanacetum coccineum]